MLYPTIMRELLMLGAAEGLFSPFWSDRILEEWARATAKLGPVQELYARREIALLKATNPASLVAVSPKIEATLYLPDANDVHVLATAISAQCTAIISMNLKDFPRQYLLEHGIEALHPDAFLLHQYTKSPDKIAGIAARVCVEAERLSGESLSIRKLFKKARLPRLGKALEKYVLPLET